MATRNSADINLVIRAKTEGEKLVEALSETLEHLFGDATKASGGISELGKMVDALGKGLGAVNSKFDAADGAYKRQQDRVQKLRDELAALKQQSEATRQALAGLHSPDAIVSAGRNQDARLAQISALNAILPDFERKIARVSTELQHQDTSTAGAVSSLQRLASTANAIEAAQGIAQQRIASTTIEIERQTAAAQRAAAVAAQINQATGVGQSAAANGATFELLVDQFQRLTAEALKVREAIDPVAAAMERAQERIAAVQRLAREGYIGSDEALIRERQLQRELDVTIEKIARTATAERERIKTATTEYQNLINTINGVTGTKATDAGATFGALDEDQKRREAAVRAREAEQLRTTIDRNAGIDRVPASDAGATFSALAGRAADEEAQAVRAASTAHAAFEQRVRDGAKAMQEEAAAARDDANAIYRLREKGEPAALVQERLNNEIQRYKTLLAEGKVSQSLFNAGVQAATESANAQIAAIERLGKSTHDISGKTAALFGLKPYELHNLGYQINDVITQLASGTKLSQVLAQQGGQIIQIFPKAGGAILSAVTNPAILAGIAAFGLLALSIKSAADNAQRLRDYTAQLQFRADGGNYNAAALAQQERTFERLGASSADAKSALSDFLNAGIAPDRLKEFSAAAQATADALGVKLPEAAHSVTEAFTQGYKAVAELDDKLNFLTAAQREQIRTLFDEGRASEARNIALDAYTAKISTLAQNSRGPWAQATRDLTSAFHDFTEALGHTTVAQDALDIINGLAAGMHLLAGSADDATTSLNAVDEAHIRQLNRDNPDPLAAAVVGTPAPYGSKPESDPAAQAADSARVKRRQVQLNQINFEDELQRLRDAGQTRVLSAAEKARREELAGLIAARQASDEVVAGAERRRAIAHETAEIARQDEAARKKAEGEREKAINDFEHKVTGAEGGAAKNPYSTAKGFGQFTETTFLEQYKKLFGDDGKSRSQILDQRGDPAVAKGVIDQYARENAKAIERIPGAIVTAANLYLLHFLGAGTGSAVLRASPSTPVDEIIRRSDPRNAAAALSGNQKYLRTENGTGRYRTAAELKTFLAGRVSDTGSAQSEAQAAQAKLASSSEDRQENLNKSIAKTVNEENRLIAALKAEDGLRDGALLTEQRNQAVTKARLDLIQRVEDANKNLKPGENPSVVTPEQIDEAQRLAAALFDVQHAKEVLNAPLAAQQRDIDQKKEEVSLLEQEAQYLRSIGDNKSADAIDKQITKVNSSMASSIDALIAAYEALTPAQLATLGITDEAFKNLLKQLQLLKQNTQEWGKVAGVSGKDIAQAFAGNAASSFTNFINKVASGENVFRSLGEAIREFAANFIGAVAQMILQILAYAAAVAILKALGVTVPGGGAGGAIGAIFGGAAGGAAGGAGGVIVNLGTNAGFGLNHSGGMAGSAGSVTRRLDPAIFAGAMRFHNGGIPGLAPDEVPIIARRTEEVLTEGDPRHRNNGGLTPSGQGAVHIYNLSDPDKLAEQVLRSPAGERAIINFMSENKQAVKVAMSS